VSDKKNKQNPTKDTRKGAEFWGLPENFANTNDYCKDFTIDTQYMKDHPENRVYRNRIAAGKTHCFDCLWESECACIHPNCPVRSSFYQGYNLCPKCDADIGKQVRSEKWPNCPWCGTKLKHSDFYHPPIKNDTDKDEQCEHKRLYIKFAWAQNLEAESEWSSIFGETSKTYHLRMAKGGEWQNHSWQQESLHVRRVVCLDCMELLYDRGCDSWSIVPECMRQIIRDSASDFMSKIYKDMKKDGFVIIYDTKDSIAKWPKVEEADRVK